MVLKKPYAFFIKFFKPIHVIIAVFIGFLFRANSGILSFLSNYISTYSGLNNTVSASGVSTWLLIAIPILVCILSLLILGIMIRKKKPVLFYVVIILIYIAIIVVNVYAINFLKTIGEAAVSIRISKLIHDFVFLAVCAEAVTFFLFLARGLGLNIKKFDFDSDLLSMDISESDMEEFEVSLNLNIDETRRKRRRSLRMLKYRYAENKFFVNSIVLGSVGFIVAIIVFVAIINVNRNTEGKMYNINGLNVTVNDTFVLNTDYLGNKITNNYLVVVSVSLNSPFFDKVYLKDFNLRVGDVLLKPTTNYNEHLSDLGTSDSELEISLDSKKYILVYEIPEKIKNKKMLFRYTYNGNNLEINLKPDYSFEGEDKTIDFGEDAVIVSRLGKINFRIDNYELKEKYSFEYSYCIKDDDCVTSLEYLVPSLNENFDKAILRLNVEYLNESNIEADNFYDFFSKFGSINYSIDGEWKVQKTGFEELLPLKVDSNNYVYIGVNSEMMKADSLKLVFNVRESKHEYLLK